MKTARLFTALLTLVVLGAGCTQPSASTTARTTLSQTNTSVPTTPKSSQTASDNLFIPPTGADTGSGVETPGRRRLMTATSTDGLAFTRSNTVVTDQANVPDMVMDADGTLYLYYAGWTVGDRNNTAAVAISKDQGATWIFYQVDIGTTGKMMHSSDPDVVLLDNGTFRLFSTFNLPNSQDTGIFVSESTDGIHFKEASVAFQSTPPALDSNTALLGDIWHMWTLAGKTLESHHATSTDGLTFTQKEKTTYLNSKQPQVMSNILAIDGGGYRMYGFNPGQGDIRSFTSPDGQTWTAETGVRLTIDTTSSFESEYVKDPAVIKLLDGTYLMVYVTQIP